jgi:hypothetical protein
MKMQLNKALGAILAAGLASISMAGQVREVNTSTEGSGTLSIGGKNYDLTRATMVIKSGGTMEVLVSGDRQLRLTGRWGNGNRGRYDLDFRGGALTNVSGSGDAEVDRRSRLYRLNASGNSSSGRWTIRFNSENGRPWEDNDGLPNDWQGLTQQASGTGTIFIDGRSRNVRSANVWLKRNGDAEITFFSDSTYRFTGQWHNRQGNTVDVVIDNGPNARTNARGEVRVTGNGRLNRIEIDGRDADGRLDARFNADNSNRPPMGGGDTVSDTQNGRGTLRIGSRSYDVDRVTYVARRDGTFELKVFGEREYAWVGNWDSRGVSGWTLRVTRGMNSSETTGTGTVTSARGSSFSAVQLSGRGGSEGSRYDLTFRADFDSGNNDYNVRWVPSNSTRNGNGTVKVGGDTRDRINRTYLRIMENGRFECGLIGNNRTWRFAGTYRRLRDDLAEFTVTSGFGASYGVGSASGTGRAVFTSDDFRKVEFTVYGNRVNYTINFEVD